MSEESEQALFDALKKWTFEEVQLFVYAYTNADRSKPTLFNLTKKAQDCMLEHTGWTGQEYLDERKRRLYVYKSI